MDIIVWVLQAVLAVKGLSTALIHGLGWKKESLQQAVSRFGGSARGLLVFSSIALLLGSLGVALPQALGFLPWLTPLSAAGLALGYLVSIGLHIKAREKPMVWVSLILAAMALCVAVFRWELIQ